MRDLLRRIGRALLWPVRRMLDPRFAAVHQRIEDVRTEMRERLDLYGAASVESLTYVGEELRTLGRDRPSGAALERLDPEISALLEYAESQRGWAAEAGLWFNPPVALAYREGRVTVAAVNEGIVELPFAFRALSRLRPPARVLDLGGGQSTLALSLASLGYQTTLLDPRPARVEHPNLEVVASGIEDWNGGGGFDAVLCLSPERVGEAGDEERMLGAISGLLSEGGFLVLSVPLGERLGEDGLKGLLSGWEVEEQEVVRRNGERVWGPGEPGAGAGDAVALLVARPA